MGLRITFEATGEDTVERTFLGISRNFADGYPVLTQIAAGLRALEVELFDQEDSWAPLRQATIDYKAANDLNPKILQATEEMRKSLVEDGLNHIEYVTEDELIFGTADPKAQYHRHGTRNMPKRDPLIVTETERLLMMKAVQRYIIGAERGTFGLPGYSIATFDPFGLQ